MRRNAIEWLAISTLAVIVIVIAIWALTRLSGPRREWFRWWDRPLPAGEPLGPIARWVVPAKLHKLVVVMTLATLLLSGAVMQGHGGISELQFAADADEFTSAVKNHAEGAASLRSAILTDSALFAPAYMALGVALLLGLWRRADEENNQLTHQALGAAVLIVLAFLADMAENEFVRRGIDDVVDGVDLRDSDISTMRVLGGLKLTFLVASLVGLFSIGFRRLEGRFTVGTRSNGRDTPEARVNTFADQTALDLVAQAQEKLGTPKLAATESIEQGMAPGKEHAGLFETDLKSFIDDLQLQPATALDPKATLLLDEAERLVTGGDVKASLEGLSWAPPAEGRRVGICLSGGGIRSASFSMGAVQALSDERTSSSGYSYMDEATYLSAVSGGGYLATGLAISNFREPAESATPTGWDRPSDGWAPDSPEERHFRDNSSYLVPNLWQGSLGFARLLTGIIVNVLLVWLVLFAMARPVGWAMGSIHEELTVEDQSILVPLDRGMSAAELAGSALDPDTHSGPMRLGPVQFYDSVSDTFLTSPPPTELANNATVEFTFPVLGRTCFDTGVPVDDDCALSVTAQVVQPGRVRLDDGTWTLVRQPVYEVADPRPNQSCLTGDPFSSTECASLCTNAETDTEFCVSTAPCASLESATRSTVCVELIHDVELVGDPFARTLADLDGLVRTPPPTALLAMSRSGLATRADVTYEGWMWGTTLLAVAFGALFGLVTMFGRIVGPQRWALRWMSGTLAALGSMAFMLYIGFPWLVTDFQDALASVIGVLPGIDSAASTLGSETTDYVLPTGGFLTIVYTALRAYTSANSTASDPERSSGALSSAWRRLRGMDTQLGWYGLSAGKIAAAFVSVFVPFVLFVGLLQWSSANGPNGRLMGFAFIRDLLPGALWLPDFTKWLIVIGFLLFFRLVADASSWSLHPFYKQRLAKAYLVERDPGNLDVVRELPYDKPVTYHNVVDDNHEVLFQGLVRRTNDEPGVGPQLITCCAVNLSESGVVPPGRRAGSWTFSSDFIGGPVVGYVDSARYWDGVGHARQKDLTITSAMSISGAAFSPAMGKFNLGPSGTALALANLRLGTWLPHPQAVQPAGKLAKRTRFSWWINRPGWTYFLREYSNRYKFGKPYLYVSDGGHWENLGLVELLRRGCTEIVCVNASGDTQAKFAAISEAIALAREEIGVEIELDPTPLRPPLKPDETGRELRRPDGKKAFARQSYAIGTFTYPQGQKDQKAQTGTIYLMEPALTKDMPWDVHGYAEDEAIFPDDSTGDQVYNHRQFEAFRRLGHHQASLLLAQLRIDRTKAEFGAHAYPPAANATEKEIAPAGYPIKGVRTHPGTNREEKHAFPPGHIAFGHNVATVWFRSYEDAEGQGFDVADHVYGGI